ncbi:hypothetical protein BDP55DRAFT_678395 [Colletotrichum godetiae]|uniref:Uncharacterized protein n=1 Tax=Colletotrichum godetiae TaxID=1209918 RepID=A0AAJ0AAX2_9PEZI|nr:uncharacterized protein BDP55DRAFT_678395 [Colletotrichum godetiae]KAK1659769.1 hypothetical protein BDP55DRAFT_678395 [Colletotrichum godetiae]
MKRIPESRRACLFSFCCMSAQCCLVGDLPINSERLYCRALFDMMAARLLHETSLTMMMPQPSPSAIRPVCFWTWSCSPARLGVSWLS